MVITQKTSRLAAAMLTALLAGTLAACGGGGSGGTAATPPIDPPTPPPGNPNRAPTISGTPATTVMEGVAYSFQPTASDPDSNTLSFSASGLPVWLTINSSSGLVSGTPPAGSSATYPGILVSVSDGSLSASLPAFSLQVTPRAASAELHWTAPTQNEDGTALTNLAGYKVRYGQSVGTLSQLVDVTNPTTTTVTIQGLTLGTWYFTVASYTNSGVESAPTGAVSKTIT